MEPLSATVRTVVSGVGFMSDAYDLFIINIVKSVLFKVYPLAASAADNKSAQTAVAAAVTTAALVGAIFGQLLFGAFADRIGRRAIFVCTISLVIVGALGSATCSAPPGTGSQEDQFAQNYSVYWQLVFWRSVLGFGVGGEYPLSATVTSEAHALRARGRSIALVFAQQGAGNLLASLVMVCALKAGLELDVVWRLALGLGALPGLLSVYWRWRMEESEAFVRVASGAAALAGKNGAEGAEAGLLAAEEDAPGGARAEAAKPSWAKTLSTIWEFRWVLAGTAGSWFIFDVVFYGNGLFSSQVLSSIGYGSGSLLDLATGNALIALIGLPGYVLEPFCSCGPERPVIPLTPPHRAPSPCPTSPFALACQLLCLAADHRLHWPTQHPAARLCARWRRLCRHGRLSRAAREQLLGALRRALRPDLLLLELRAEHVDLRHPGRGLPDARARHVPRHLGRLRQGRRRHRQRGLPHYPRRLLNAARGCQRGALHLRGAQRAWFRVDVGLYEGDRRRRPRRARRGEREAARCAGVDPSEGGVLATPFEQCAP